VRLTEDDHLIKAGMSIVDLGSAPGSWSQYVRNRLTELGRSNPAIESGKPDGQIIAIDILPMEEIADVTFIQADFREDEGLSCIRGFVAKIGWR
jgi:23S rRNA (uridine2552-2'-O)-methyltransferase